MSAATPSIYIVEDEALIAMELADQLAQYGYEIQGQSARGEKALEAIAEHQPDIVLMDINLAGELNGIETASRLHDLYDVPVVFLSAYSDSDFVKQASNANAFGFLVKPFNPRELNATLQTALYKHRMERRLKDANTQLEDKVREHTAELEASNRELASFNYSISHDLRTPLRGIDGWSFALQEEYSDLLDQKGLRYITQIRKEAQRLGQLIGEIRDLSRIGRNPLNPVPVDLSTMAQTFSEHFQQTEPERAVEWRIAPGLQARGNVELLKNALTNLLDNAWKFTSKRPEARIEFGRRTQDGEDVYFIRDNGAGFDSKFATKLFSPFERLHRQSEFPGNGIGLASVQRIINRHGGRIWAESVLNGGATFYFTLPIGHEPTIIS